MSVVYAFITVLLLAISNRSFGLAVPPFTLASSNGLVELEAADSSIPEDIVVITHAAGRMGKLLAAQIREDATLSSSTNTCCDFPKIRAVVRSNAEALSVKCDLGGMTLSNGQMTPIPCDWLKTVVVDGSTEQMERTLKDAFDGATATVLRDSSHNEVVWSKDAFTVRVPAKEVENQDALSERILLEIQAAASSKTLQHTILRSPMGLSSRADDNAQQAMGGEVALGGARRAEVALSQSCESTDQKYTILRFGALIDDPGMVPLLFGTDGSILLKRMDCDVRRPPILSRADAARLSNFVLKRKEAFQAMTIDCAWHPKYGRSSSGTEEAIMAAGRQNLEKEIMATCTILI